MVAKQKLRLSRLQFRLSWLIALTFFAATVVRFGPPAWYHISPPAQLPSMYYAASGDDLRYFPKGPTFRLSAEAAALKAARRQQKKSDSDAVSQEPSEKR